MGLEGRGFKGGYPVSCRLRNVRRNHHSPKPERYRQASLALAGLLLLALLCTQSLGLWHRLVHFDVGHPVTSGLVSGTVKGTAYAHSPPSAVSGLSGKLFSNHHADTDCQLFDQLSHADGVTAALAMAVGQAILPHFARASHGLAVARWHALFQARAPPSVR